MKSEFTHNGQILLNDPKQVFVPRTGTIPVFLDLDGTMFKFRKDGESYKDIHGRDRNFHFEDLWEEGYYRLLPPIQEMVDAVNQLHDQEAFIIVDGKAVPIEFNILSAVLTDSNYAFNEKNTAVDEVLPWIPYENRVYVPCGDNAKADRILITERPIRFADNSELYTPILIDDYSKNLWEWAGGTSKYNTKYRQTGIALKFYNGINNNFKTWESAGFRGIRYDDVNLAQSLLIEIQACYDNFLLEHKLEQDVNRSSLFSLFAKDNPPVADIYAEAAKTFAYEQSIESRDELL